MILIGANERCGKTTALNYFADPSFEPSVKTWRWDSRECFAYLYTISGTGDPYFSNEQFKRAVPCSTFDIGRDAWLPSWPYTSGTDSTYKNFCVIEGELAGTSAQEAFDERVEVFHNFVNNHAETVYNYLSTKGQIIEVSNCAIWIALVVWSIKNNRQSDIQCWTIERTDEQMCEQHKEIAKSCGFLTEEGTMVNYVSGGITHPKDSGGIYKDQSERNYNITDADILDLVTWRHHVWCNFYDGEADKLDDRFISGKRFGGTNGGRDNWGKITMNVDWNYIRHIDNRGTIEQFHANLKTAFDEYNTQYGI